MKGELAKTKHHNTVVKRTTAPGGFTLWVIVCVFEDYCESDDRESLHLERPAGRACWGPARRLGSGSSGVEAEVWEAPLLSSSHLQKTCWSRTWKGRSCERQNNKDNEAKEQRWTSEYLTPFHSPLSSFRPRLRVQVLRRLCEEGCVKWARAR